MEDKVVSMAAAREWRREGWRGRGGGEERGVRMGRTGEEEAAGQRVRGMGSTERWRMGWEWDSGPKAHGNSQTGGEGPGWLAQ